MILDRLKTLRKSQTSIQREGQAHSPTNISTIHHNHTKLQTPPHLPYERSAGFAKCSKSPTPLPPLSKGGGLTARHKLLLCCVLLAIRPSFYIANFSAVKTEGLLHHYSPRTNPSQTALSHPLFVGRGFVCAWLALRPCKALGHTRLRHP